jgi:hypothetical protein
MSIGKAQAKLLAEGFLDDIGSEKDGLQPRETLSEVIVMAGELVERMQDNLNKSNSVASGKLSESIKAEEPETVGQTLIIDITCLYYGDFVNKGVKGTKSGSSKAGYSFKTDFPSAPMLNSLIKYTKGAGKKVTNIKNKPISKLEKKNIKLSEAQKNVYGLGISIKRKGIKSTGFIDKAVKDTSREVEDKLGAALRIDIINSLQVYGNNNSGGSR